MCAPLRLGEAETLAWRLVTSIVCLDDLSWKLLTMEAMSVVSMSTVAVSMVLMGAVHQAVGNTLFYCWESGRNSFIAGNGLPCSDILFRHWLITYFH